MLIKQQALTSHLAKKISGLYLIIGQDCFLLNSTADSIKKVWCPPNKDDYEETTLPINNPTDWERLDEEANSYSLFAHKVLIDVRYEKENARSCREGVFKQLYTKHEPSLFTTHTGT